MTPRLQNVRWSLNAAMESWLNCRCSACTSQQTGDAPACKKYRAVEDRMGRIRKLTSARSNS